jgi:hypothetical protein
MTSSGFVGTDCITIVRVLVLLLVWSSFWWASPTRFGSKKNQSLLALCAYTFMSILGTTALWQSNLAGAAFHPWRFLQHEVHSPHPPTSSLFVYLDAQFAWYAVSLVGMAFDRSASDSAVMCLHHCFTLLSIAVAFITEQALWVLAIVLLMHDYSDVLLHFAKLLLYRKAPQWRADVAFALFAVSFFIGRLVLFPQFILAAAYNLLSSEKSASADHAGLRIMVVAAVPLLCMHIYWFRLICRIICKTLRQGGAASDIRDD